MEAMGQAVMVTGQENQDQGQDQEQQVSTGDGSIDVGQSMGGMSQGVGI